MKHYATTEQLIKENVKVYEDFPIKGVSFVDLFPLFTDPDISNHVVKKVLDETGEGCLVVLPESRGFIMAGAYAVYRQNPVVFLRKEGKMPSVEGDLHVISYKKEYGEDKLFFRQSDLVNAYGDIITHTLEKELNIVIFDDILATGNTAKAIAEGIKSLKLPFPINIVKFLFIGEIDSLEGRKLLTDIAPVTSLCKF